MATAAPYHINWATGTDKLLIVSVGTGNAPTVFAGMETDDMNLIHYAKNIPRALMNAAAAGWDMSCRIIGECRFGPSIDREFGDMVVDSRNPGPNWSGPKQFAYVRYDPDVTRHGLDELGLRNVNEAHVAVLDSVKYIGEIQRVGKAYAARNVNLAHLANFV